MQIRAQDALEDGGYTVVEASNGEDAIQLLTDQGDQIIGLVTDVRLGKGMNGWEVARRAREQKASLPVVYLTAESTETGLRRVSQKACWFRNPTRPRSF